MATLIPPVIAGYRFEGEQEVARRRQEDMATCLRRIQLIHVTCAIIERNNLILAAQRSRTMKMPLKWEFPGGKIDSGETAEASLRRELMEELRITVTIQDRLKPVRHAYNDVTVILHPFVCTLATGEPVLVEHAALTWLPLEQLDALDWAAADVPVLEAYRRWKGNIRP